MSDAAHGAMESNRVSIGTSAPVTSSMLRNMTTAAMTSMTV